jgi:biopolymer transport protein TolR
MAFDLRDRSDEDLQPSAEINVTPFIDVMLVLLIIFMVTAPLLTQGVKVELPKVAAAPPVDNKNAVTITVSADGQLQVGDNVVALTDIVAAVRRELVDETQPVRIRGDAAAPYGSVLQVIDRLTRDGLTRLTFLTSPEVNNRKLP